MDINGMELMKMIKNDEFKNGDLLHVQNFKSPWVFEDGDFKFRETGDFISQNFTLKELLDKQYSVMRIARKPEKFKIINNCLYYKNNNDTPSGYSKDYSLIDIQFAEAINWLLENVKENK